MDKQNLVVLTGAGMSAESGIKTFRDAGGLWEGYDISEVATPEAWQRNPHLVLDFYNQRRRQLAEVAPHEGHKMLSELEAFFNVQVVTQNVDNLHERAGSSSILHLHGELVYAKGTKPPFHRVFLEYKDILWGDQCAGGSQIRPDIVWFGEPVPAIHEAMTICSQADMLVVVGTSLEVYPAAGLIDFAKPEAKIFIIDPNRHHNRSLDGIEVIAKGAKEGLKTLSEMII